MNTLDVAVVGGGFFGMYIAEFLANKGHKVNLYEKENSCMARAFYHQRSVLVIDEATSSLDNKTEQEIVEEIHHLKGKKTLIVIAHRLTTVQHCDRIYRLEDGQIVDKGTPEKMLKIETKIKV